ncbi:hypothetical protein H4696_000805 [Amycolatopsis lexingtonensis]|uniref:Uncharacterized protein n=1 Tax=Amycolatopsis lexingtonensis TaxID=218822 RepID=A0ABR9HRZ6_9PSEU|nr:hypothetical protein [Amycolatopsis lexingtonensis]MBE1493705.1 hypothetical protein [Amycolatopsis lexingtonensis]
MTDFRGLGFDPVPGNPDAVAEAARRCTETATRLREIRPPGETPEWAGPSARAQAERAGRAATGLTTTPDAMDAAAAVLDDWAGTLLAHHRRAEELDARAGTARRAVVDAEDDVERAETEAQFSPSGAGNLTAARARLSHRQQDLDRVLAEARDLERAHATAAARVAGQLRALGDGAPLPAAPDFRGLATQLESFSAAGRELGVTVARTPGTPVTPPPGAVSAFAAALGGR